ncbi:MAG: O-antigen ligase family protein [Clostridia bacterium]|nr:O-antigen ligase family protein [Clostridia bacterium]
MNRNKSTKKNSSIFSCLARFSEYIYSKMPESFSARLLIGKKKSGNGLFSKILTKFNFKKRVSLPVKRYVAKCFDNSFIFGYLKSTVSKIPLLQMKCIGLFYFSFGLYSTVVNLIKTNFLSVGGATLPIYLSIGSCVVGGILCGTQKSCYAAFSESKILSGIFFGFFNIPRNESYLDKTPIGRPMYFLIAGIVAGILGSLTSVQLILLLIPVLLILYAIFAFPESGAVALFLALPFLSAKHLAALSALVTLSYLVKLIRGKRVFNFTFFDLTVLAFGVVVFFGGIISVSPKESSELSYTLLAMLCGYFAVSNLLRTSAWIKKCGTALIVSYSASLLAIVLGEGMRLLPEARAAIFGELFSDSILSILSINPVFIHMAVAVVPLMMLRSVSSKNSTKTVWSILAALLSVVCLFTGGSRSGTLALIIGLTLLLMLVSRKSLSYIIPAVIIIPLVIALLPSPVTNAVNTLFSFDGTIASYRQSVNFTTNKIITDSLFGGIGLGDGAFEKIYPLYANDLSLESTHTTSLYAHIMVSLGLLGLVIFIIFIAQLLRRYFSYIVLSRDDDPDIKVSAISAFAGLSALLIMGLIDDIWHSPSVFLMFWLVTALFIASVKTAEGDRYVRQTDEPTLEIDCKTLNHFSKRKG